MSDQPAAPTQSLSFDFLSRVHWPSVARENNPVLWKRLTKYLLEPETIDESYFKYTPGDGGIEVGTPTPWGPEYDQLPYETDADYFSRTRDMYFAELHFERELEISKEGEEMELEKEELEYKREEEVNEGVDDDFNYKQEEEDIKLGGN